MVMYSNIVFKMSVTFDYGQTTYKYQKV